MHVTCCRAPLLPCVLKSWKVANSDAVSRKPNCPSKLCVLDGFVFAFDASCPETEQIIFEADRGPQHTVRHRPGRTYHDYWCSLEDDGWVPPGFRSKQCRNLEALIQKEVDKIKTLLGAFTTGVERLLLLVPRFQGVAWRLTSKPELSVPMPSAEVCQPRTFTLSTVQDMRKPWHEARNLRGVVQREVRNLCEMLRLLRALHQLARQRLHGSCLCAILVMLGSASYLPKPSNISVTFEEDEVKVQPELVPPKPLVCEDHEVIQTIEHLEPAAEREPELTALQVDQDWADQVAAQIQANRPDIQEEENVPAEEKVHLLQYNRHSERFHEALNSGKPLESCRTALEAAGFQWLQPSGAKVFVHPWQFESTMTAIAQQNLQLRPYHVIVSESLEYYVEASLSDLPCRDGARVKTRQVLEAGYSGDQPQTEDEDLAMNLVETRTFLCAVPRLRSSNSVTQSTTEVHGGLNPRRVQLQSVSED